MPRNTTPKAPSAKFTARVRAFADVVDLGIGLYAGLPDDERDALIKTSLEYKQMALQAEPPLATLRSLAYLEDAFFTYWNEASGDHVKNFWQRVVEGGFPFERKDIVRKALDRGRITNDMEYQTITDSIVIQQQIGKLSQAEANTLSKMLGKYEERAMKRKGAKGA